MTNISYHTLQESNGPAHQSTIECEFEFDAASSSVWAGHKMNG